jgi:hypothetical protein
VSGAVVLAGDDDAIKATIRDPRKLSGKLSDALEDVQMQLMLTPAGEVMGDKAGAVAFQELSPGAQMRQVGMEGMAAFRELTYATLVAYVESWTYDGVEQEVTRGAFEAIPHVDRKALTDKVGVIVDATGGGPRVDVTGPKPGEGPSDTPTGPSSV